MATFTQKDLQNAVLAHSRAIARLMSRMAEQNGSGDARDRESDYRHMLECNKRVEEIRAGLSRGNTSESTVRPGSEKRCGDRRSNGQATAMAAESVRSHSHSRTGHQHFVSRNRRRNNAHGYSEARRHIQEAEDLSRELGGTDQDVKDYFFSLPDQQRDRVLDAYEKEYGQKAREYAEMTLPDWRSGKVRMSGMNATRLFRLLPPMMPIEVKYRLVDSLWKHVGPSSHKTYFVGLDAVPSEVAAVVKKHLEDVVVRYTIPASMESRFRWLSAGDVAIKQQLLNHLSQRQKSLLTLELQQKLPVLLNHLNSSQGTLTTHVAQVLEVGNHQVTVQVDERVSGISESGPASAPRDDGNRWLWWVAGGLLATGFLMFNGR